MPFPKKAEGSKEPAALARIIRPEAAFRWTGQMLATWTPQTVEMTLRSALAGDHVRAWELFDLMEDTWPRLRKNVLEIKNAVGNMSRVFSEYCEEGEEPSKTATEKKKLVSHAMRSMRPDPAEDEQGAAGLIFDILDARFKGTTVMEIGWHIVPAGQLGEITVPRAAWWVHPTCFGWNNGRLGLTSNQHSGFEEFPPDKFLLAISKTKTGSPLAGALLRPLAWWWCASNFSADWLLNLAQVFGLPFRWANYEANATQATVDAICNMLANMGSAGWAAFPAGTTLELKAEGQKSGDATPQGNMLDRADTQCDLLILGQTLTSQTGGGGKGGGSLALGKVHESVKYEVVMAAAAFVKDVLESQLFPMILRLNYGEDSECPEIEFESEDEGDQQKDASVIGALADAGAGGVIGLDWLGKKFGIPKPAAGERTLGDVKADGEKRKAEILKAEMREKDGETEPGVQDAEMADRLKAICAEKDDEAFLSALRGFGQELEGKDS